MDPQMNPMMQFILSLVQGGQVDPMQADSIMTQLAMRAAPPDLGALGGGQPQTPGFAGMMSPTEAGVYGQAQSAGPGGFLQAPAPVQERSTQAPATPPMFGGADPKTLAAMMAMLNTPKPTYPPAAGLGSRPQLGNMQQLQDPRQRVAPLSLAQLLGGR